MKRVLRRRMPVLGALVFLAIGIVLGFALTGPKAASDTAGPDTAGPPSTAERAALKTMATDFAARSGEPSPSDGQVVGSSRVAAVEAVMGEQIYSDQPVYVVTMHGHFVGYMAHMRPGAPPPTGTDVTLVVDANTNELLDWSISDRPSDLSTLGTPAALALTG